MSNISTFREILVHLIRYTNIYIKIEVKIIKLWIHFFVLINQLMRFMLYFLAYPTFFNLNIFCCDETLEKP